MTTRVLTTGLAMGESPRWHDGETREVADDLWFPNGMAVTPDQSTLIVAESHASRLTAFTITADGSLTDRRSWAELGDGAAPDGICLDADGRALYIVATDWQRLDWQHGGGERTGQVLMYDAPAPHAGRPCAAPPRPCGSVVRARRRVHHLAHITW